MIFPKCMIADTKRKNPKKWNEITLVHLFDMLNAAVLDVCLTHDFN